MFNRSNWMGNVVDGFIGAFMRTLRVAEIEYITERIRLIHLCGNLSGFNYQVGYAVAILVGQRQLRNYTVSAIDVDKGTIEIIIHLHGNGPGSDFFHQLLIGDEVQMSTARGLKQYYASNSQHVFFGDETSLATAVSLAREIKRNKQQGQFIFELDECNLDAPQRLGIADALIYPKQGIFGDIDAIGTLDVLKANAWQNANYILTGNVSSIQQFKKSLKALKTGAKIISKGYWLAGKRAM